MLYRPKHETNESVTAIGEIYTRFQEGFWPEMQFVAFAFACFVFNLVLNEEKPYSSSIRNAFGLLTILPKEVIEVDRAVSFLLSAHGLFRVFRERTPWFKAYINTFIFHRD